MQTCGFGDLGKFSTVVAVQVWERTRKVLRSSVSSLGTSKRKWLSDVVFTTPPNVVGDEQIKISVIVVVEETAAGTPFFTTTRNARFVRNFRKMSFIIPKQMVGADR